MYVIASRFWRFGSDPGLPDLARSLIARYVRLGWTHEPKIMRNADGVAYECGCPDCVPDSYGN